MGLTLVFNLEIYLMQNIITGHVIMKTHEDIFTILTQKNSR